MQQHEKPNTLQKMLDTQKTQTSAKSVSSAIQTINTHTSCTRLLPYQEFLGCGEVACGERVEIET